MASMHSEIDHIISNQLHRLQERTDRWLRSAETDDDPRKGWTHETVWRFTDGETITIEGGGLHSIVLPAAPGSELLSFRALPEDDPATIDMAASILQEPIIGWAVNRSQGQSHIEPITQSDLAYQYHYHNSIYLGILQTDSGRVHWFEPDSPEPSISEDRDAWIEHVRLHWVQVRANQEAHQKDRCPHCGNDTRPAFEKELDNELPF